MNPKKETWEAPSDPDEGTQEAPPDPGQKTQEAQLDPEEETREEPSDLDKETREAPSDSQGETKYVAGFAAGLTNLKGPVVPTCRKLAISGNLPPNDVSRTWSRWVHAGVEGAAPQSILPTTEEVDEKDDKENATAGAR